MASITLTPNGIVPTLFVRVWLDTLSKYQEAAFVRTCQRPGCDNELPEGARPDKLYCGGTCQKADRRRLQRLDAAGA